MIDGKKTTRGNPTRIARGFTLVEMVIVIGVIILLAALTLSVSVAVVEGSEVRQTENTIRLLTVAIQEWEAQADRQVTYGIKDEPYGNEQYEIEQPAIMDQQSARDATAWLFAIISRPTSVKPILAQVDPDFVQPIDFTVPDTNIVLATLEFSDAWGNPIVAVFPGRTWVDGDDINYSYMRDSDGTILTPVERVCGGTTNRQICFVSAGPDGVFGDLDPASPDYAPELAGDNVYSYEPTEITTP